MPQKGCYEQIFFLKKKKKLISLYLLCPMIEPSSCILKWLAPLMLPIGHSNTTNPSISPNGLLKDNLTICHTCTNHAGKKWSNQVKADNTDLGPDEMTPSASSVPNFEICVITEKDKILLGISLSDEKVKSCKHLGQDKDHDPVLLLH